jgi:hypothetical protein
MQDSRPGDSPTPLGTPLFALACAGDGRWQCIGGPFDDVDDLLDCCFGHMMEFDLAPESVGFIETQDGRPFARSFPRGAFPEPEEAGPQD